MDYLIYFGVNAVNFYPSYDSLQFLHFFIPTMLARLLDYNFWALIFRILIGGEV